MKAKATQETRLTKDLVDSSQVTDANRVFLINPGTELEIKAIAPQIDSQGKRMATFSTGLGAANFNTWFLYPAHWQIDGEPRKDFAEAKSPTHAKEAIPKVKKNVDWWDGREDFISQFFTEGDVTNGDSRRIPAKGSEVEKAVLKMAAELDKIRQEWGCPIGVTSWYRPPQVNREVGGAIYSQHLTGGAVDVYTLDDRDLEFEDFLDRHWGGGLGYGAAANRRFTHLDMREGGWRRGPGTIRWTY